MSCQLKKLRRLARLSVATGYRLPITYSPCQFDLFSELTTNSYLFILCMLATIQDWLLDVYLCH